MVICTITKSADVCLQYDLPIYWDRGWVWQ